MQKYNYLVCNLGTKDLTGVQNDTIQNTLNARGSEGWELVSTIERQQMNVGQQRLIYIYGIFKRLI